MAIETFLDGEQFASIQDTINSNFTELDNRVLTKAERNNVLELDNSDPFTPTADYHPATKLYVDEAAADAGTWDMLKSTYDTNNNWLVDNADYDNTNSTLTADNIQAAVDEVDMKRQYQSAGVAWWVPNYIDNWDGTIDINSTDVYLFSTNNFEWDLNKYTVPGNTSLSLLNDAVNYIVIDYNAGSPIYKRINNVWEINESNIVPVYTIVRTDTILHSLNWDSLGEWLSNKIHKSIVKTQRYRRQNGLALAEKNTRELTLTDGIVYVWVNDVILESIDTAIDNLIFYYKSDGSWTSSLVTQYNNSQYDDGTDLQPLGNNDYWVCYIYRWVEDQKHLYMTLWDQSYNTLADAQEASITTPPNVISQHAVLVGKIIVEEWANTATSIESAFDTKFTSTTVTSHQDLLDLQGGATGEYYHLTSNEYTNLALSGDNISIFTNDADYIPDAPSDGNQYARQDGSWSQVEASSGWVNEDEFDAWTISGPVTLLRSNAKNRKFTVGWDLDIDLQFDRQWYMQLKIINGGNYVVTWNNNIEWAEWVAPSLTADGMDYVNIHYNGTTYSGDYGYNFA